MRKIVLVSLLAVVGLVSACGGSSPAGGHRTTTRPAETTTTTTRTATVPSSTTPSPTPAGPRGGPVPAGVRPASVTFVSAGEGFVLGASPTAGGGEHTDVLRTMDGGRSWAAISAPDVGLANNGTGHYAQSIRFADPEDGYIFADNLFVTHDGGGSWHALTTVAGIEQARVGNLVAIGGAVFATVTGVNRDEVLVRGAPGSDTFSPVPRIGKVSALAAAGDTVIATIESADQAHVVDASGHVRQAFGSPGGEHNCQYAASSAAAFVAVCGQGAGGGSMGTRHVYGSTDGGAHWTRLPDPGIGAGYDTGGVAVTTGEHAMIGSDSGASSGVLTTTDGGTSWRLTLDERGDNVGVADLGYTTSSQGVVVIDPAQGRYGPPGTPPSTLYLTRDGGMHWSAAEFRS